MKKAMTREIAGHRFTVRRFILPEPRTLNPERYLYLTLHPYACVSATATGSPALCWARAERT